jgi:hypothetical protein
VPSARKATALTPPMSATINRQGCVGLRRPGLVNIVMSTSTRFCPKSADTTAPLPMPVSETVTNIVKALANLPKTRRSRFSMALSRFARRTNKDRVLALRLKTERLCRAAAHGRPDAARARLSAAARSRQPVRAGLNLWSLARRSWQSPGRLLFGAASRPRSDAERLAFRSM